MAAEQQPPQHEWNTAEKIGAGLIAVGILGGFPHAAIFYGGALMLAGHVLH